MEELIMFLNLNKENGKKRIGEVQQLQKHQKLKKPHGCRHGQVDQNCSLSHKKLQVNNFLNALKVEIFMYTMINMKKKIHFNIINLKDEHFLVDLSRFYNIAFTCKKCPILQNGLQVSEILNVFYFQVMKASKNIFVL